MADSNVLHCIHQHILILSGIGSLSAISGMSLLTLSTELKDKGKFKPARYVSIAALFLFVAGILMLASSLGFFLHEREERATNVASQVHQLRTKQSAPDVSEPFILGAVCAILVIIGVLGSHQMWSKKGYYGWIFPMLTVTFVTLWAYCLATKDTRLSSVHEKKLAWTLPGAVFFSIGFLLIPYLSQHHYLGSGIQWICLSLGFVGLTVGSSLVVDAPEVIEIV